MKNKLKIQLQTIPSNVIFTIGKKAHDKVLKKLGIGDTLETSGVTYSLLLKDEVHTVLIAVSVKADILSEKALIVHEISHAVTHIMDEHGFRCDEFRSYLCQYLYIDIMKFYEENRKK